MDSLREDFEIFIKWAIKNERLAQKYYPEQFAILEEASKNIEPHRLALIIEEIPNSLYLHTQEINSAYGSHKEILINQQIELYSAYLSIKSQNEIIQDALDKVRKRLKEGLKHFKSLLIEYQIEQIDKELTRRELSENKKVVQPGEVRKGQILFKNDSMKKAVFENLKQYFENQEVNLWKALSGEEINTRLYFPFNQKILVEVFRRLTYNNQLLPSAIQIRDWMCNNYTYLNKRKPNESPIPFNPKTVYDYLTKVAGNLAKSKRICQIESLPYLNHDQIQANKKLL